MTKEKALLAHSTMAADEVTKPVLSTNTMLRTFSVLLALSCLPVMAGPVHAETTGSVVVQRGASGLPLPRFVSLGGNQVNMRVGPGLNYAIEWRYVRSGIPMEIIQEYDNWRRVRDAEGAEGWINQALLSGRRTAVTAPWQRGSDNLIDMHATPSANGRVIAQLEPGVIGALRECDGQWCEMEVRGMRGWVQQVRLWGAYPGETYSD